MEISSLKRDSSKIRAGQWISDIPGMGDLRLKVRGMTSQDYIQTLNRKQRAVPRNQRERDGSLKLEDALRTQGEAMHEAVLIDWDGLTNDGEAVPYDSDIALTWLLESDYQHFADAVVWAAQVVDRGRAEVEEELSGNSKPSRGGKPKARASQST